MYKSFSVKKVWQIEKMFLSLHQELTNFANICKLNFLYIIRQMTIKEQIIKTIERSNPGSIYFNNSFPKYDDVYVRQILSELCSQGVITRISNGIYVKPILSKFGVVFPPTNDIVRAIARRDKAKILPTGNTALNQLGLSTQIPMNSEYITSGSAREIKLGNRTIRLKRSVPKNFDYKGELMPTLVQAMKAIGPKNLTDEHIGIIRKLLTDHPEDKTWYKDILLAPAWIRKIVTTLKKEIANEQMD